VEFGINVQPSLPGPQARDSRAEAPICDHLSEGRFEFGTGCCAGWWEMGLFNIDPSETEATWDEVDEVIVESEKMWETQAYHHDGPASSTPGRNVVPKPHGGGRTHPPMWMAAGNAPTCVKAARLGLRVLGFNLGSVRS
jgi:alkanesulfonate monooxygenase SsuD/methylene tetrahydromethanopterin reductase-like flavin-dependent oxidoreductase (luciferase family)